VVAAVMIVVIVVALIVVVAVVFMVPVAFMDGPTLLVVVVVRMAPMRPLIGRPLPRAFVFILAFLNLHHLQFASFPETERCHAL
jgi:hypothetical protein